VGSLTWYPDTPLTTYVTTGARLTKVELVDQECPEDRGFQTKSVHEVTMLVQTIRLANKGLDEVVSLTISTEHVSRCIGLLTQGSALNESEHIAHIISGEDEYAIDRFCCDWILEGFNGRFYALVHYASSKQQVRRVARKVIKEQGKSRVILRT